MTSPAALSPPLPRAWIAAHIPHAGSMCLLDEVVAWDDERICCTATSHRDPGNPLFLQAVRGVGYRLVAAP